MKSAAEYTPAGDMDPRGECAMKGGYSLGANAP
jgi:hypothetical protein